MIFVFLAGQHWFSNC